MHRIIQEPNRFKSNCSILRRRRILGGQAIGVDGVDKRLDVLATAIHFQATVRQLSQLDLAYAPPFGSAKDPIHMAAFAACNDLDQAPVLVKPTQT